MNKDDIKEIKNILDIIDECDYEFIEYTDKIRNILDQVK